MTFGLGRVKYGNLYLHSYQIRDETGVFLVRKLKLVCRSRYAGAGATNRQVLAKGANLVGADISADIAFTDAAAAEC